jgi:hypothetical protein
MFWFRLSDISRIGRAPRCVMIKSRLWQEVELAG